MDFRILGSLEVVDGAKLLALGSRKQRALLALLLVHAGEVVSRDRMIDELWRGDPPRTAELTLHSYVSRLRACVGGDRLLTRAPGYVLAVGEDELDARRFERLVQQAREESSEVGVQMLREALSLWRGAALVEFADESFAQGEARRLEELRLTALEERFESELALGRHVRLVGELEAAVAEQPLRERLRAQFMLALYRSGRQSEALDTYREVRRLLTRELGLEPGEALKSLERAILVHDADLVPPTSAEVNQPLLEGTSGGTFVGREAEQEQLLAGLADALAGRGRLILISGEPGIGKSRLAEELAGHARRRGAQVLGGRCWEAGGAPAFWPFVQVLRGYIRAHDPEVVRRHLGGGAAELAQILPEVRELVADLPMPSGSEPEEARFRLFDATASFLRNAAVAQPLVLVLDDLHAADTPSLLLLQFIADSVSETALLLVGAYRDVDPAPSDLLSATLAELTRKSVTRRIALGGLREPDVRNFIEHISGHQASGQVVGAIQLATEGNPLFIGEIVRLLVTEGTLDEVAASSASGLMVPEGVKAVIGRRLHHLSEDCKEVLVLASILGREFQLDVLEQASGLSRTYLLDLLDEAVRARVVGEAHDRLHFRFGHALICDTLVDELPPGRRAQLHLCVGEALEVLYVNETESHLAELAHHFVAAATTGNLDKAVDYAFRAGGRAVGQLAYEEAVRLYEVALTLVPDGPARCEVLLALGNVQSRSGDTPASKRAYRDAADLASSLGLRDQLAISALGYGGRFLWDAGRDDPGVLALLERALVALGDGDSRLRVRLLARLAGGPLRDARFPSSRRLAVSTEALETARVIGDASTLAYALAGYVLANDAPDKTLERLALATELVEVALEAGEKERAVEGHEVRLLSLLELGEIRGARAELEAMASLAAELQQPSQQWFVVAYRALLALIEGRLTEAETLIEDAYALGSRVHEWSANVSHRLQLYVLRRDQGRVAEIEQLVRTSVRDYPSYPIWRCVLTQLTAELGQVTEARASLEFLSADDFAALPFDEEWLVSASLLAETLPLLNDASRAAMLYEQLLPYADRVGVVYIEFSTGSVSRYLGILASTMARWAEAETHFEKALAMNRQLGAGPLLARTQHDYAHMLRDRAGPGDAGKARLLDDQAMTGYREFGMPV